MRIKKHSIGDFIALKVSHGSFGAQVNAGIWKDVMVASNESPGSVMARKGGFTTEKVGASIPFSEFVEESLRNDARFKYPVEKIFFRTESGDIFKAEFDTEANKIKLTRGKTGREDWIEPGDLADYELTVGKRAFLPGSILTTKVTKIVVTYGTFYGKAKGGEDPTGINFDTMFNNSKNSKSHLESKN